jgi:hypothetical protein
VLDGGVGAESGGSVLAQQGRVDEAVLLEEAADALVAPEELNNLAVELDVGGGG